MFMSNKPMTIEKWCEEMEKVIADEVHLGGWGTAQELTTALQIIRRQQEALNTLRGSPYLEHCDERILDKALADCDAIVESGLEKP